MRDCKDCEFFEGYDEDGIPNCEKQAEDEGCPFNDEATVKDFGFKMSIDTKQFSEYISETMRNTAHSVASKTVESRISSIVTKTYEEKIKKITEAAIEKAVEVQICNFMSGTITIGGGWREPERILSREEYLTECIQDCLKSVDQKKIKDIAAEEVKSQIVKFSKAMREDINRDVKKLFDEATRQTLTASVVDMLMTNDTYQKLSSSMGKLLPEKSN